MSAHQSAGAAWQAVHAGAAATPAPSPGGGWLPAPRGYRTPTHPGHFLETRYLKPLGISQTALADALGVSRRRVNELLRGHRAITADSALRLGLYFGHDPRFWMDLQSAWDVHEARRRYDAQRACGRCA